MHHPMENLKPAPLLADEARSAPGSSKCECKPLLRMVDTIQVFLNRVKFDERLKKRKHLSNIVLVIQTQVYFKSP